MLLQRKITTIFIQFIISLLIVGYLLYVVDLRNFLDTILKTRLIFVVLAILTYFLMNLFLSYRIKYVLQKFGKNIKSTNMIPIQFGAMLASDVTPGRVGFVLVPPYKLFQSYKVRLSKGYATIISIQSVEFYIKAVASLIALVYLTMIFRIGTSSVVYLGGGIAVILIGATFLASLMWSNKLLKTLSVLTWLPLFDRFLKKMAEFQRISQKISIKTLFVISSITLFCWLLRGAEWSLYGAALNIHGISFIEYLLLFQIVSVLSFIPVTPAGIGIMEGGAIAVFLLFGVSIESALAFSIIFRGINVFVDLVGLPTVLSINFWNLLEQHKESFDTR